MHTSGFKFQVLPDGFLISMQHPHSEAWNKTFGKQRDETLKLRVDALYRKFKRELIGNHDTPLLA